MVEIKITGDSAPEALGDLAHMALLLDLAELHSLTKKVEVQESKAILETEETSKPVPETPAEAETPTPVQAAAVRLGSCPEVQEGVRSYTLEEIRKAGIDAAKSYGKQAVQDVLQSLGTKGMSTLPPEKYPEFMRKLGEIHAG